MITADADDKRNNGMREEQGKGGEESELEKSFYIPGLMVETHFAYNIGL